MHKLLVLLAAVLAGVVFSGKLRTLPGVSSLPQM